MFELVPVFFSAQQTPKVPEVILVTQTTSNLTLPSPTTTKTVGASVDSRVIMAQKVSH